MCVCVCVRARARARVSVCVCGGGGGGGEGGAPFLPKLLTAVVEEVFEKADISEGISVDGENHTNLRFADDVAVFNKNAKEWKST